MRNVNELTWNGKKMFRDGGNRQHSQSCLGCKGVGEGVVLRRWELGERKDVSKDGGKEGG